jgi:hypothetical protein
VNPDMPGATFDFKTRKWIDPNAKPANSGGGVQTTNTPADTGPLTGTVNPDGSTTVGAGGTPAQTAADQALKKLQDAIRERALRDQSEGERQFRASAALGRNGMGAAENSGSFDSAYAKYSADSNANLEQALAGLDYNAFQTQQDANLKEKLAQLGSADTRYGVDKQYDSTLKGQETQYKIAQLNSQVEQYKANVQAQAAAAGASAQQAAAYAQMAASKYESDLRYQLGLAGLDVQREGNAMDFSSKQFGNINDFLRTLWSMSPDVALNGSPWDIGTILTGLFPGGKP